MGYIEVRKITPNDVIWACDDCGQEGVQANGKGIYDNSGVMIMWFCYNCKERMLNG